MPSRTRFNAQRGHPSRHLLYSFLIGAVITAIGFLLASNHPEAVPAGSRTSTLVVSGSETLRPLASACAEDFMMRRKDVDVVVRGGGTSTGVAALLAGQVDLAMASRGLTDAELKQAAVSGQGAHVMAIATEAIAVLVHPGVSVAALDADQLAALLDGHVADWSDLSSHGGEVVVVGRAGSSGTAAVVEEKVLGGRQITSRARLLASHEDVIEAVAATPGAIGYADAQLSRKAGVRVKLVGVSRDSATRPFLPEPVAVSRGDYLLSRTLSFASLGHPTGTAAQFTDFCRTGDGRRLIEASGFLPVVAEAPAATR